MTNKDLLDAMVNKTKVWLTCDSACYEGIIVFLGIKPDRMQVEIVSGEMDKQGEGTRLYRAMSDCVFAKKPDAEKKADEIIDAKISELQSMKVKK